MSFDNIMFVLYGGTIGSWDSSKDLITKSLKPLFAAATLCED